MYKNFLFLIFLPIIFLSTCLAQEKAVNIFQQVQRTDPSGGSVQVFQDPLIERAVSEHLLELKKEGGMMGWRINIFFDSGQTSKDEAFQARSLFTTLFPDITPHLKYDEPDYKVYVGDFRTKSDAYKYLQEIKRNFPYAFLVSTVINFPKLD